MDFEYLCLHFFISRLFFWFSLWFLHWNISPLIVCFLVSMCLWGFFSCYCRLLYFFLQLIFSLISLWSEKMLSIISIFLNLVRLFFTSVQFRHSVVSNSLRPHELQHTRPPCPSPTPGVTQTHVHRVSDAIQPSHPLLSLSPPAFNLSQHKGLFKWVSSSHQVAKVLEFQLQHESFQCIFTNDFL